MVGQAYEAWEELWEDLGQAPYVETGSLALSRAEGDWADRARATLDEVGIGYDLVPPEVLGEDYPFLNMDGVRWGLFKARGGVPAGRPHPGGAGEPSRRAGRRADSGPAGGLGRSRGRPHRLRRRRGTRRRPAGDRRRRLGGPPDAGPGRAVPAAPVADGLCRSAGRPRRRLGHRARADRLRLSRGPLVDPADRRHEAEAGGRPT